jgi:hypothetical protein
MGIVPATECVAPVYDYPHANGNNCIIGGLIPDGCGWSDAWKSRYIFGDNGTGNVWTLQVNAARSGASGPAQDFGKTGGMSSFRMGADDALYIVEVSTNSIQRITPKGQADACGADAGKPVVDSGAPRSDASVTGGGGNAGSGGAGAGGSGATGTTGGGAGNTTTGGAGTTTGGAGASTSGATTGGAGSAQATTGGGGSTGATSSGGVTSGTTGGAGGTSPAPAKDGGCGCRTASPSDSVFGATLPALPWGLALALALARRRRSPGISKS